MVAGMLAPPHKIVKKLIFLCLQILTIFLKVRGDNVSIYQNMIIHYNYLHNNLRTFDIFLDQLIYVLFCPLENAPPRPSLVAGTHQSLHVAH